jgi:hypothetical protein
MASFLSVLAALTATIVTPKWVQFNLETSTSAIGVEGMRGTLAPNTLASFHLQNPQVRPRVAILRESDLVIPT